MDSIKQQAVRFLQTYEMDVLDIDFDKNVQRFLDQIEKGLAGQDSSLEMIPTYLEAGAEVPAGKQVIVADAGGTHFRVATVHFDDNKKPIIENLKMFEMPGIDREVSKDEFFSIMAGYFEGVIHASDQVGFCFSYPVEIFPSKDGRLIRFAKEIKAPEVVGRFIGKSLNLALDTAGAKTDKHIVLLNDTVATLLAGCGYENRTYSSYIGFILGTGTNTCYIEENANIRKINDIDPANSQIINIESGGFAQSQRGKIDIRFNESTINPKSNLFEKMISGAYLGPLFLEIVRQACEDGLFSSPAVNALDQIEDLTTKEMNLFVQHPYGNSRLAVAAGKGTREEVVKLYCLADRLTERAAKLTAINLSSAAIRSGQGTDPTRPICIVAEGTTFYKMKTLKSRVEYYLKEYLENKRGIYTEIISVDNATLVGAAIAALTN